LEAQNQRILFIQIIHQYW